MAGQTCTAAWVLGANFCVTPALVSYAAVTPLSVPVLFSGVIWVIGGFNQVPESSSARYMHAHKQQSAAADYCNQPNHSQAKNGNAAHDTNYCPALISQLALQRGAAWKVPVLLTAAEAQQSSSPSDCTWQQHVNQKCT